MTVPGSDTPADTPVVVAARRTPIGTAGGALRAVTVDALAAPVLAALAGALGGPVDDVLLGNVFGPGGNPARVAALAAGLGDEVPGMTVDRQCASGLAAILTAAAGIRAGDGIGYLAGGAESPSTAPTRTWADGTVYTRAPFAPAGDPDPDMGPAADDVAARAGLPRTRLDAFAARSHARAVDAQRAGRFDDELVPVDGVGGPLTADERPRDRFTADRLARFRPAFTPDGVHTAANSCGVNDGAAAVALVPEWRRRELGVPGLALVSAATRGCPPGRPRPRRRPRARRAARPADGPGRRRVHRGVRRAGAGLSRRGRDRRAPGRPGRRRDRARSPVGRLGRGAGRAAVPPARRAGPR